VFIVLRGHDALVLASDLEGAGIRVAGAREAIGGKIYVSLQSLASGGVTYELDERALTLRLSAPTADLGHTIIDLRQRRPPDVITNDEGSGFLNYTLRLQDLRHPSAFGEAGATYKNALLYSTVSVASDGHAVRGLSSLSYAVPEHLQRYILGDTLATSGLLGGSLFLGGASLVRDFNLDPYFFRYPSSGLSGAVATPSTVDVYVNGALVHREDIAPGTFDINNLPLPVGAGNTRIVVRDAFGREQVVASPFYFSTGILKPGVSDYGFYAGFRRNNLATESWDYSPPVFLARYRFGLTDLVTPGGRLEGRDGMLSGGPQATMRTPFGDVEGAAAGSYDTVGGGAAGSLSYTYLRATLSAGALGRAFSDRYTNLALPVTQDRPRGEGDLYAGTSLGPRLSLTLRGGVARYRDAGNWNQVGLLSTIKVHDTANIFLTATRTAADNMSKPLYELYVTLTVALPDRATASAFYQQEGSQGTGGLDAQRSMGLGPDYGYHVRASLGPTNDFLADGQAQSAYGRYEASAERVGGHDTTVLSTSGALVTVGGHVFATRPVQQGFGLIEVPGVAGVRGTLNNQEIGRTDSDGNLLVPEMIPYYANRVGIADEDLPMDYRIDETERLLAPPLQGGAVARFDVVHLRTITGSVLMNVGGVDVAPRYGQMLVHVGLDEHASPIGKQGEFYFENLQPGTYPAEIDASVGTCRFDLVVPAGDGPFIDAGRSKCIGRVPPGLRPEGTIEPLGDPPAAPAVTPPPATTPPPVAPPQHDDRTVRP
jgi:outer membrane usher protein